MIKTHILFVCLGNICRSASAEAVLKNMVKVHNLDDKYYIDSAGTSSYHTGENADSRMQKHAQKRKYNLTSISRQINIEDLYEFDYIIAMDENNLNDIKQMCPHECVNKLSLMTDYSSNYNYSRIPDPYYGGDDGFELVLDLLEDACAGLLNYIESEK